MKITVTQRRNYMTASAYALAADFKHRGMDKYRAWDEFVKMRGLRPEIDAREFYEIFGSVSPLPLVTRTEIDFQPTHYDTLLGMDCQITTDERGVYYIVWADGSTGSNPPTHPPAEPRFRRPTPAAPDEPSARR